MSIVFLYEVDLWYTGGEVWVGWLKKSFEGVRKMAERCRYVHILCKDGKPSGSFSFRVVLNKPKSHSEAVAEGETLVKTLREKGYSGKSLGIRGELGASGFVADMRI